MSGYRDTWRQKYADRLADGTDWDAGAIALLARMAFDTLDWTTVDPVKAADDFLAAWEDPPESDSAP